MHCNGPFERGGFWGAFLLFPPTYCSSYLLLICQFSASHPFLSSLEQETSKPKLSLGENLFYSAFDVKSSEDTSSSTQSKPSFLVWKCFKGHFFRLGNKNIWRVWSALNKYFVLFLSSNIVSILSGTIKRLDKLWWFQFVLPMNE